MLRYYYKRKLSTRLSVTSVFRPYHFPYPGSECSAIGDMAFLVDHLIVDHKVDMHIGCRFDHLYVKSTSREIENAAKMLIISIQLLQPSLLPAFSSLPTWHCRKLIWEGTPRSIREYASPISFSIEELLQAPEHLISS
ncbi:hypothetical protein ACLB2K_064939 [Fragaria x ananassa]